MRARILLVEDEQAFAEVLTEFLAEEGYSVLHVRNGVSALSLLASPNARLPDLVVCDVMLPGVRGDRIAKEIRARLKKQRLPIILMSASADPRVNAPDVSFLSKPFDNDELLRRIESMLAVRGRSSVASSA
ncbi:MAG: response regulator transcription factor [Chloroflexi bacterium]|nr:response regulator transcription factor [Chloroflexota bacterium]MBV9894949.1 response regulator transcription factor [Chloroflexota bacterium]